MNQILLDLKFVPFPLGRLESQTTGNGPDLGFLDPEVTPGLLQGDIAVQSFQVCLNRSLLQKCWDFKEFLTLT